MQFHLLEALVLWFEPNSHHILYLMVESGFGWQSALFVKVKTLTRGSLSYSQQQKKPF